MELVSEIHLSPKAEHNQFLLADDVACAGQTRTHDVIIDRLLARCSSRYECRPVYRDDINAYEVFCFVLELRH